MPSCFLYAPQQFPDRDWNVSGLDLDMSERICQLEEPCSKKKQEKQKDSEKKRGLKISDDFVYLFIFFSICLSRLSFHFAIVFKNLGYKKWGVILYQH